MNLLTKLSLIKHLAIWHATWAKRNTKYRFSVAGNPRFMSARDAIQFIRDGDVVATSGLAGNQRQAIMYWAIRELFDETGHPQNLTMMCTGGQGARGKVPGTMEELGVDGLCIRLITGHQETFKSLLKQAQKGKMEFQCLPQGVITFLIEAQGRGEDSMLSKTGIGTFMDPRVGCGSHIFDPNAEQLVTVEGDWLRYRAPKINVAMFGAPAADREGNIYLKNCSVIAESKEIVRAAKANGGKVIVNVGRIVKKGYAPVDIPAEDVDAIVYDKNCEQAVSIKHRKYWPMLTTESNIPIEEAIERIRFINRVLKITPVRTEIDDILARLAALTFIRHAHKGMYLNIGVGLPEEMCRMLFEAGVLRDVNVFTESGVIGGVPAPGVFFGAAICPRAMVPSADIFRLIYEKLDMTVLGVVEADSDGNVNVSRRGEGPINYVGPGGFIDITTGAKTILFVASWMNRGKVDVLDGAIQISEPGKPKFVEKVAEITFSGQQALKAGKTVLYVTTVGVFHLTSRGLELISVMPGVDIEKDILQFAPAKIVLPESGTVPVVDPSVISGKGFQLSL
jgi:propionate CoA-transferase